MGREGICTGQECCAKEEVDIEGICAKRMSLARKRRAKKKSISTRDKAKSGKRMQKVGMTSWPTLNYESLTNILAAVTTK